ncbi:MAG: glycoside hydrolase family 130 protein, partial [Melioribacter sp.]|nr:glycoside hydrolase family 130 protein [Melioribacter sp.]
LNDNIPEIKKLLIGSYFSNEYSLESTALFNPSMVWHPDQSNLPNDKKRFIISLRATGEGHVSSIVFRSGVIDLQNNIELDEASIYAEMPSIKLISDDMYEANFEDMDISERTLFPQLDTEMNGMEDARFVLFTEDNGVKNYYATYCAYDGHNISMQLLRTKDFMNFTISKLKGAEVQNKGMALFPRKINGKYVMLSRQDNENNFIMFSDNLYQWDYKQLLMEPKYTWEFFQIGNCGSPIETEKGWLCLSHGVGPARRYSIGAFLLDKNDPTKLIGRLREPLLEAKEHERNGYVPNVVYSCGGVINGNYLVFPYAMSDYVSSFAYVNVNDLLNKLLNEK